MTIDLIGKGTWLDKVTSLIISRERNLGRSLDVIRVESGIGASGIPHLGSIGDAVRAHGISLSLKSMGYNSVLIAYSDDMDGLRKIPVGFPDWLTEYIAKPVSKIPDPYGDCHNSYGSHISGLLLEALDSLGVDYEFRSASDVYRKGMLSNQIDLILSESSTLGPKIAELVGQEKYKESLPYFPICESCGRLYVAKAEKYVKEDKKVLYHCDRTRLGNLDIVGCGHRGETSILSGNGKLAWKVEFAARWSALDIRFEAYGKDIMDSVRVNDWVSNSILGYDHPLHVKYEMFLDKGGKKISKSAGNVFTPQTWLRYGTPESLLLLLFKRISGTRQVSVEDIPLLVDEYDLYEDVYFGKVRLENNEKLAKMKGIYEYVNHLKVPNVPEQHVPYRIIAQQASLFSGIDRAEKIYERLVKYRLVTRQSKRIMQKIQLACNWADDFLVSDEIFKLQLTHDEKIALSDLVKELETYSGQDPGADLQAGMQNMIYTIARKNNLDPRKFFKLMYRILINSDSGPKLGNYIVDLGIDRVRNILINYCS
jgi:lysyl-tRNA synthetase, class I